MFKKMYIRINCFRPDFIQICVFTNIIFVTTTRKYLNAQNIIIIKKIYNVI